MIAFIFRINKQGAYSVNGIRNRQAPDFSTYVQSVSKAPEKKEIGIRTLDEARTYVAAQRFTDKTHAQKYLEKLDVASDLKIEKQALSLLKSAIQNEIKTLPERSEKAEALVKQRFTIKPNNRLSPEQFAVTQNDMQGKGKRAPILPMTLGTFAVIRGLCSSQPRVDEHNSYSFGGSAAWSSYRAAAFDQSEALDRVEDGHPGACVIYSAQWLKQIAAHPSNDASSRMDFLDNATPDVIAQQQDYADRVHAANQSSYAVEDPFFQTIRAIGINPGSGDNRVIDITEDEESAMSELAEALSRQGSSNFIWLDRPDDCSASKHVVATHAHGNRIALFDPNIGEFRVRRSEIPTVMRAIIGDNSMNFPIPDVTVVPVHP
ncbi:MULTISPECIES: YopT-type cysteine protease domain-containing protein [unclassified Brenneria]|uniref:YopT-type cysteine protease domain-containing protein n=1 Tax=unclassified Brenneria TaxID=2634434 RepID=UPI0015539563|nr:YopT-type cysteine protease domain-containing protein [Brenneria sp. hezel4-2-4]MEE3651160.1 YopT-type cysteine protease domain-containing protein [Brenneria sp. HEZEL_4_2_4]NPD01115.1 hypothetical protein [Brenneria sp. hezel4-2-4]